MWRDEMQGYMIYMTLITRSSSLVPRGAQPDWNPYFLEDPHMIKL